MAHRSTRGSRPGEHRGGRKPGVPNKSTQARILGFERVGAPPELATLPPQEQPLTFLLTAMKDATLPITTRIDAAKAAAPYIHFRKGLVDTSGNDIPLLVQVVRFSDGEQLEAPRPVLDMGKAIEIDAAEENRRGG